MSNIYHSSDRELCFRDDESLNSFEIIFENDKIFLFIVGCRGSYNEFVVKDKNDQKVLLNMFKRFVERDSD